MDDITPEEPKLITPLDPNKVRGEEIKYGKKLDRHLSKIDKIEMQMKQSSLSSWDKWMTTPNIASLNI